MQIHSGKAAWCQHIYGTGEVISCTIASVIIVGGYEGGIIKTWLVLIFANLSAICLALVFKAKPGVGFPHGSGGEHRNKTAYPHKRL